jgi:hypothetical protein
MTNLPALARRATDEDFFIQHEPAYFETTKGVRTPGEASVHVTRSSIAIRFTPDAALEVGKAGYMEANGAIGAAGGGWIAPRVNDFGAAGSGERLFGAQELVIGRAQTVAATRLVFAGTAWEGTTEVDGRALVAAPLSGQVIHCHDARLSLAIDGACDGDMIEILDRTATFVSGLDIELLRVDEAAANGDIARSRIHRGYRRVGRGPHDPFVGIASEHRMRAFAAIASAIPRLKKQGAPIIAMINHMGSHNTVAEIDSSAAHPIAAVLSAAYHHAHGAVVGAGAASRRAELAKLNQAIALGLDEAGLDRFEKLRVEIMEAGFFHAPGYETGRPQKDIKFLRDLAHLTVFRLCGYTGPFYGSEFFAARNIG